MHLAHNHVRLRQSVPPTVVSCNCDNCRDACQQAFVTCQTTLQLVSSCMDMILFLDNGWRHLHRLQPPTRRTLCRKPFIQPSSSCIGGSVTRAVASSWRMVSTEASSCSPDSSCSPQNDPGFLHPWIKVHQHPATSLYSAGSAWFGRLQASCVPSAATGMLSVQQKDTVALLAPGWCQRLLLRPGPVASMQAGKCAAAHSAGLLADAPVRCWPCLQCKPLAVELGCTSVSQLAQQQQQRLHHFDTGLQGGEGNGISPSVHKLAAAAHSKETAELFSAPSTGGKDANASCQLFQHTTASTPHRLLRSGLTFVTETDSTVH